MTDLKLTMEIEIPVYLYHVNLHKLDKKLWNKIRKEIKIKYDNACCICRDDQSILDCHEQWYYDFDNHIQVLKDILLLCKKCHGVKHLGSIPFKSRKEAREHFLKVNNCDLDTFNYYYEKTYYRSFENVYKLPESLSVKEIKRNEELKMMREEVEFFIHHHFKDQEWYFSYPEHLPFYDEVTQMLKDKGLLMEVESP